MPLEDEDGKRRYKLVPCPFCGTDENLEIVETDRLDEVKRNKRNRVYKQISIRHRIECWGCGARAGESYLNNLDGRNILSPANVSDSEIMAVLMWNTRTPINEKAYELVNEVITQILMFHKVVKNES